MIQTGTIIPSQFWQGVCNGEYQILARIQAVACEWVVGVNELGTSIFTFCNVTDGEFNALQKWARSPQEMFHLSVEFDAHTNRLGYWRAWDEILSYAVRQASEDLLANYL